MAKLFDQNFDSKCILFIDEIDAIFSRGKIQEKIAFQLISELRRIAEQNKGLYVMAATNYIEKIPSSFMREGKMTYCIVHELGRFEFTINSEKSLSHLKMHLISQLEKTLLENCVQLTDVDLTSETMRLAILSKTSAEISALNNFIRSLLARGAKHSIRHVFESFLNGSV